MRILEERHCEWSQLESIGHTPWSAIHTGGPVIILSNVPTNLHHLLRDCGCESQSQFQVPRAQSQLGPGTRPFLSVGMVRDEKRQFPQSPTIVSACLGGQEVPCRMNRTTKTNTTHSPIAKSQPWLSFLIGTVHRIARLRGRVQRNTKAPLLLVGSKQKAYLCRYRMNSRQPWQPGRVLVGVS